MPIASVGGYSAGKFLLEIEGEPVGFALTLDGGEPFGSVVPEPVAEDGVVRKHVGLVEYAPIRVTFGVGMSRSLYEWMAELLDRRQKARSGAIVLLDYNFKEQSRLEFQNALITELAFPALDATAKGSACFTLTFQPETTRLNKDKAGNPAGSFSPTTKQKTWVPSNFRIQLGDLPTKRVNKIDGITLKQAVERFEEGRDRLGIALQPLEVPNLSFTLPEIDAKPFDDWLDDFLVKGKAGQDKERGGTLEFLDASLQTSLFALEFGGLGILRVHRERGTTNAAVVARVAVELYCEEMKFKASVAATASAALGRAATAPLAADNSTVDTPLTGVGPGVTVADPRAETASEAAERVARRLAATARPASAASASKRDQGVAVGERWATERATLEELEQVAALESAEWSALHLDDDHSLIVQLGAAEMLPRGIGGPFDLDRDAFVEDLVAGAASVLRSVAGLLGRSPLDKSSA